MRTPGARAALFAALFAACTRAGSVTDAAPDAPLDAVSEAAPDAHAPDAVDASNELALPDVLDPPGPPRFNRVWRAATHNSYWVDRSPTLEPGASGTQERLLDQLLFDHARGIELDVHRDPAEPGSYRVFHSDNEGNVLCTPLRECLRVLRAFHAALPMHEALTVVVELKELQDYNFDATHTPADLDSIFTGGLSDTAPDGTRRSWLYTPRDFLARCPAGSSLRACAQSAGWPTTDELRGRFVLGLIGNWRIDYTTTVCRIVTPHAPCLADSSDDIQGHGPAGWVTYATWGNGVVDRAAFPIRSNWLRFNATPDTETVDPAALAAAEQASVLWQVEDLTDPSVPAFLEANGVVRGADSFAPATQRQRVLSDFQLVQTDYPWLQLDERGPSQPLRPLGPLADPSALLEPGKRLFLRGPADESRESFAYASVAGDGCTAWQTVVSVTRPSPDPSYAGPLRPRGVGCLRAWADPLDAGADGVELCRGTSDGEFAELTWTVRNDGVSTTVTARSPANTADGVGELLRLEVCTAGGQSSAHAFASGSVALSGLPEWTPVGDATALHALAYQGLAARRDVLFVATRRDARSVAGLDLAGPVAPREAGQSNLIDGMLADLSYPAPTAGCHDPAYPSGCNTGP